jgi:hypothetical protein
VAAGKIARTGSGKKNNPYSYAKACSPVPVLMESIGNNQPASTIPEEQNQGQTKVVPASHINMGNKGTRNTKDHEKAAIIEQKLVPGKSKLSQHPEEGGNKLFPTEVRI